MNIAFSIDPICELIMRTWHEICEEKNVSNDNLKMRVVRFIKKKIINKSVMIE